MTLRSQDTRATMRAKPLFEPRCSQLTFSSDQWQDLRKHGRGLERLASGDLIPKTDEQAAFAAHFKTPSEGEADCYYEKLWEKYLFRVEWENDPSNVAAMGPLRTLPEGGFGTREDYQRLHSNQSDRVYFLRRRPT